MKPSEFLKELDSHGIYSVTKLEDLDPEYRDLVPTFTGDETRQRMDARGLGGEYTGTDDEKVFYGWPAAAELAAVLTGELSHMMGRGSSFRDNISILERHGF